MEVVIISIVSCLLLLGVIGSIIPILPGPILSFVALLVVHFFSEHTFSILFLFICAFITLLVFFSDYFLQYWGIKNFGGGKRAVYGTFLGIFIGLFIPPIGIFIGPFLGAFIGSIMDNKSDGQALKIALGSLIGFLFGSLIKLFYSISIIIIIIKRIGFFNSINSFFMT